jgi:hypothetical protein
MQSNKGVFPAAFVAAHESRWAALGLIYRLGLSGSSPSGIPGPGTLSFSAGARVMKPIVFVLIFALLPGWAAAQEQPKLKKPVQETQKPAQAAQKPCAEYGPGFVRIAGTNTCVKVGGSVQGEAGSRR